MHAHTRLSACFVSLSILAAGTLGIIAVAPASAEAARVTHSLKGSVQGDSNSVVSVKVVVKNGEPKRLKGLRYENVDQSCDDVPAGEISGRAGKNVGTSVEFDGSFRWVSYPQSPSRYVNMYGKLKNRGRKLGAQFEVFDNDSLCNAKGKVKLRK